MQTGDTGSRTRAFVPAERRGREPPRTEKSRPFSRRLKPTAHARKLLTYMTLHLVLRCRNTSRLPREMFFGIVGGLLFRRRNLGRLAVSQGKRPGTRNRNRLRRYRHERHGGRYGHFCFTCRAAPGGSGLFLGCFFPSRLHSRLFFGHASSRRHAFSGRDPFPRRFPRCPRFLARELLCALRLVPFCLFRRFSANRFPFSHDLDD
jgi:hypothetical protein